MGVAAEEAIEMFGNVCKANYLAHTIREIESYILRQLRRPYQIQTYVSQSKNFKCDFFDRGCTIRLPISCDEMSDGEIRIRLAHELGHIIQNIDKLDNPEFLEKKLGGKEKCAEEIEAWKFAYYLIQKKSKDYQANTYEKFIFKDSELAAIIQRLVKDMDPAISEELGRTLPFVH